jgi:competence protein ComGC
MTNKKLIILLVSMVAVLLIIGSYFILVKPYLQNLQTEAANYGVNYGVNYTVTAIANAVATCQQVPIPYGNSIINITAVECFGKK